MKHLKKIISVAVAVVILASVCVVGSLTFNASGTGAGLAEWALNAYNSHWKYVYGGSSAGAVDCSGLIYSYCGGARVGTAQLNSATESGNVSSGIPRVHGLGLYQPGHVGVYVGNGMAVDARNEYYGVCYEATANKSWTKWFKLSAVSYVTDGWEKFNGNYYYYEDGQYVVSCSKTIGGETYTFSSSGVSDKTPSDMSAVANKNSSGKKPASSGKSSNNSSNSNSSSSNSTTSSVLKLGSSGSAVTKLQNRLKALGFYDGVVTGYFGEATQAAYKAFQKAAGVTVDGIAGKSDLKILYSDSAPKADTSAQEPEEEATEATVSDGTYRLGDQGDEIVKIQTQLSALGYFNGECTGYFGDVTQAGVIAFQNANSLEATGEVDKSTYDTLFSEKASENPLFTTPTEEPSQELTEPETEPETQPVTQEVTEPASQPDEPYYQAEENVEAARQVVLKTNRIAKRALAGLNERNQKKAAHVSKAEDGNTRFVLWMLLVLGIAAVVGTVTLTFNRRRSAGAHTKGRKRDEITVRYW